MYEVVHIILLLALLICSAFFSTAETSLFNLSRRQVAIFRKSPRRACTLASQLLEHPSRLLGCLLFGNMTVNVLYFAISSVLVLRIGQRAGETAATVIAVLSFVVLLLCGEMLPKSLAYQNSRTLSAIVSLPASVAVRVLSPIVSLFRFAVEKPAIRLLIGPARQHKAITTNEFKELIEQARKQGLISRYENRLFSETIELGFLKVRHVMCPRVDMIACEIGTSPQAAATLMMKNNLTKLPVYARRIDNVVGMAHLRQVILESASPLETTMQKVCFVPENKSMESLLEFFRAEKTDTAVVVDEYGGVAGLVRLEDVATELLGPVEAPRRPQLIESIGPLRYRLGANVGIHEWADVLGIDPAQMRISTLGGLVTALLGKIPKTGDTITLNNVRFTVESTKRNRIEKIILTLEPLVSESGNE